MFDIGETGPKTITVAGVDDTVADGDITYAVSFTTTSNDPRYDGINVPSVTVTNVEP